MKLLVIGGGQMGEALVGGLLTAGWAATTEIVIVEPAAARRAELVAAFPGLLVAERIRSSYQADGALVAVKPQHVADVCR